MAWEKGGATVAGVEGFAAAPAARPGEDEEWEKFQSKLKEAAARRRAMIPNEMQDDKAEGFEEVKGEEPESGARMPMKMADLKLPSALEVAEHEMTHVPYRSWCKH